LDQRMVSALGSRVGWTPARNNKQTNELTNERSVVGVPVSATAFIVYWWQQKHPAICPTNQHHRHWFPWLLLCCTCIVEWLASSTPWPRFVTHWLRTDAENCSVSPIVYVFDIAACALASDFCNLVSFEMSVYYYYYYLCHLSDDSTNCPQ